MSDDSTLARVAAAAAELARAKEEYRAAIVAAFATGATATRVAQAGRTNRQHLRRLLDPQERGNLVASASGVRALKEQARLRAAEAQQLRESGMKGREIAEQLGISLRSVYRITYKPWT